MERRRGGSRIGAVLLGLLLVAGGVALLAAQLYGIDLRFDLAQYGWPIFVILPGVALLVLGLVISDEPGIGLAIAGSIVTTVGLILSYQWATNHGASWAYAWSLIAPTSVGAGMALWGLLHLRGRILRAGLGALLAGLVMFVILFGFFEGLLGIGGERGLAPLGRMALPIALIAGGVLIILARLWPRRRRRPSQGEWPGPGTWEQQGQAQAPWAPGAQAPGAQAPEAQTAVVMPPGDAPPPAVMPPADAPSAPDYPADEPPDSEATGRSGS
jgi:hypothetical protein